MDFDSIFEAYYNLYRAEADTPASTDDEYDIAMRLANEAINRWANYDGTYWKELFTTAQTEGTGAVLTVATGTRTYAAPTAMREAGGYIRINDADGNSVSNIPIIDPQEAQFRNDASSYAYFTGNPSAGFTLHLNPAPEASINGYDIDYVYYKKPTLYTTGSSVSEISDPYFVVHRALAQRFRVSRNPYYSSALRDAEDSLRMMQADNNSGSWGNPWKVPDRSGTVWGQSFWGN